MSEPAAKMTFEQSALSQLRDRYAELPTNREIWTCCGVGQRAYFATRFLMQHGYASRNMSRERVYNVSGI
jgi:rhodanese-related sulfurtransferase